MHLPGNSCASSSDEETASRGTATSGTRGRSLATTAASGNFLLLASGAPAMSQSLTGIVSGLQFILLGAVIALLGYVHSRERRAAERATATTELSSRGNSSRREDAPVGEHWHQAGADTPAENNDGRFDSSARAGGDLEPARFFPEVMP